MTMFPIPFLSKTPLPVSDTGHLLTECFFKAPDETPEELEHMGYPQLLHLYLPEEILVGPGIASEEVEEIFVEA
jgi:hypothetical protein